MKLEQFCEATGATKRQIRYWSNLIPLLKDDELHGNYNWREYDEKTIPAVRVMVRISKAYGGFFSVGSLLIVFQNFHEGQVILDDTPGERPIVLSWV